MAPHTPDDYTQSATERWKELLPEVDLSTMKAGIRFERLADTLEKDLSFALRPFAHRGVRSMEDFRFLALLRRIEPDGLTITEISEQLNISKAATSSRTDRFVEAGLIERAVVPHDRRNTMVTVQQSTHPLIEECQLALNDVHLRMFRSLNKAEIKELTVLLDKLAS